MQRLLNDRWQFARLQNGSTLEQALNAQWKNVSIPHDFLIWDHNDLYANADGWYRRTLLAPEEWADKAVILRFDGVYMDCDVLLDGEILCTHRYGYTAFDVELTGRLAPGEHTLMVHIRHLSPNTRWYSGAGIFRDVTLSVLPARHIVPDGVYVASVPEGEQWRMFVRTEITGGRGKMPVHRLLDAQGVCVAQAKARGKLAVLEIPGGHCWNVDDPYLYTLETTLGEQVIRQRVGLKSCRMDPDEGLFINGRHVKLKGVCLHHDLGALGAAFHEKAARRQLLAMQDMGVNALRTSHNPPARQIMDLCDELGILVVDEIYDMWRSPKTTYDNARFFDEHEAEDVASWVRRDRNHACLLMWSVGNEIYDTHVRHDARDLTGMLCLQARRHDPLHNAFTTIGSNYMPWEGAQNCAEEVEAVGYNYAEKLYAPHHQAHPEWCIYGSETASALSSRGIYKFPMNATVLSDEDQQCSSLGNSCTSWGTPDMRRCIVEDLNTPFSMGQFLWSGIDYIGEPTPYHTRSCYFGMMDTAVFPKDYWYLFRALWTDEPTVHIGIYWDWNPGQMIDVPVMTNAPRAELLLNGVSLGVKRVDRRSVEECRPVWRVPFAPGELCAIARDDEGGEIGRDVRRTPGESAVILLSSEDDRLLADGRDMTFVTISMADENLNPVENAVDRVHITVEGPGALLGVDNGDSTDPEGYKTQTRRLFSGKLLAMVGGATEPGETVIRVTSPGKPEAVLRLPVVEACMQEGAAPLEPVPQADMPQEIPVRRIHLEPLGDCCLTPENPVVRFRLTLLPRNAMKQDVALRIVNHKGIDTPTAQCWLEGDVVTVKALGDGDIWLRASCSNGAAHPRILSQQEIHVSGMGTPALDPYVFVAGGLFDAAIGDIGPGNEHGICFARDGASMAGFTQVDFGKVGSDEVTIPIFALNDERYEIEMWVGDPRTGGELMKVLHYQKPSVWNVYQPETYRLPRRLTGVQSIWFSMKEKVHFKGFVFTRRSRAWEQQTAADADAVYGDSFTRDGQAIRDIGNNVSLMYEQMDFGSSSRAWLTVTGYTPLEENPITLHFRNDAGEEVTALAPFKGGEAEHNASAQRFPVDVLPGECTVSFVFLPGSRFDFESFRFDPA